MPISQDIRMNHPIAVRQFSQTAAATTAGIDMARMRGVFGRRIR